ncbi:MAG: hypothetical protein ACOX32_02350 [Bacteroidaceae bacterium]|jgi:heme/copper-type cytochrome/quinol oxidase subunit 2|nr:hypothetical protein [Bacteroidaceae bacterium]
MKNNNKIDEVKEIKIKASSWALWILLLISAVILVLFYGVGYDVTEFHNNENLTAPTHTGTLLIWLYALVAITIAVIFLFGVINGSRNWKYRRIVKKRPKSEETAMRDGRSGYVAPVFLFTAIAVAVSIFMSKGVPVRLDGGTTLFDNETLLKLTEVCLYSIYALSAATLLSLLLSMLGVFKKK